MTRLNSRPRMVAVLISALSLVVLSETAVLATSFLLGGHVVEAIKVATDDVVVATTSTSWTSVPGMAFTLGVPSGEQGLFLATFSAESACAGPDESNFCYVRITMNGNVVVPGEVKFDSVENANRAETNSMQFLAGPMPAGQYAFKVQYRVSAPSNKGWFQLVHRTFSVLRSQY